MTVNISPFGGVGAQFFSNNGILLSGGKINTYLAGTTTPQATYTTSTGNIAHANPIILDSAGRIPTGEMWLTSTLSYKFVLTDSTDVLIATFDNIVGVNDVNAFGVEYTAPYSGAISTNVGAVLAQMVSVQNFGAVGDGTTDDTAAFTAARNASNGRYFIPDGTYLVSASPDVWADNFIASGNANIKIGSTTYNVSNAFAGRLRYAVASNILTWITDAVTGNQIIGIQNGTAGTATSICRY